MSPEWRTVLVDDERLARAEMRRLLEAHPEVQVVDEADGVESALEVVPACRPDLLFLDIHMPDGSGFDLLEGLEDPPQVVFTTAHDEHALRAFEVNALDYLLKPVDPRRLAEAIERLPVPEDRRVKPSTGMLNATSQVFIRDGEECWFLRLGEVLVFESDSGGTLLHLADRTVRSHRSLGQLEAQLDSSVFFRANRREILTLHWVERVEDWFGGQLVAILKDGAKVTLSRRRAKVFREERGL